MCSVASEEEVINICQVLENSKNSLSERFRALFTLRNLKGKKAIESLCNCFQDSSSLFKHEVAYCLGQMGDKQALPQLEKVLEDETQEIIVRHEAGEALGAIGCNSSLQILKKFLNSPIKEISETCYLAIKRIEEIKTLKGCEKDQKCIYLSVDPALPSQIKNIKELTNILIDEEADLYERYKAMFALRNIGGSDAVEALCRGLKCQGVLFKHEIAYVLGQMQNKRAVEALTQCLFDKKENHIVRHECAEALGSIADDGCEKTLKKFNLDSQEVVSQSCQVALDMAQYEKSLDQFEYANSLNKQRLEKSSDFYLSKYKNNIKS